jgi:hypothetical protein
MKAAIEIVAETVRSSHAKPFAVSQIGAGPLAGTDPICEQDPYPHYASGKHEAQCIEIKIYRDPQFHCWKAQLVFRIVADGTRVLKFFDMGKGEKPKAGPRSEYRRAWVIVNGAPPKKRQILSRSAFIEKIFEVVVGDVRKRHDGREHPECAIYSVIKEIVRRTYP